MSVKDGNEVDLYNDDDWASCDGQQGHLANLKGKICSAYHEKNVQSFVLAMLFPVVDEGYRAYQTFVKSFLVTV